MKERGPFASKKFCQVLDRLCNRFGGAPDDIVLEITGTNSATFAFGRVEVSEAGVASIWFRLDADAGSIADVAISLAGVSNCNFDTEPVYCTTAGDNSRLVYDEEASAEFGKDTLIEAFGSVQRAARYLLGESFDDVAEFIDGVEIAEF